MSPKWIPGQRVKLLHLKQEGVVVEVAGSSRIKVAVGSMQVVCKESQLAPATEKTKDPNEVTSYHRALAISRNVATPKEIDLHGFTAEEARRALENFIDKAVLTGAREVRVVHGFGSGRVQAAVHAYLSTCGAIRHFKVSDWNPGVTVIYL